MCAHNRSDLLVKDLKGVASRSCDVPRPAMFVKRLRLFGGVLSLALSASLVAQTHFCIGGDVDHLTPANVAACQAKLAGVRNAVRQLGAPADWHFVVVCDETGWKEYTSFSRREAGLLSGADYSTDPRLHWTFLRGSDLDIEQPQTMATVVTMALDSVPMRKSTPATPSSKSTRQYSLAMAPGGTTSAATP